MNIIQKAVYVRERSATSREFVARVYGLTCRSFVSFLVLFFVLAPLALVQFYIGLTNINKCPIEPTIPYWLITNSVLNIAIVVLKFIHNLTVISKQRQQQRLVEDSKLFNIISGFVAVLVIIWFVFGNFNKSKAFY